MLSIHLLIVVGIIFFTPKSIVAQTANLGNQNLALGKARIIYIHTFIEEGIINNLYVRVPFFINDTLVCRMTNNHYSIHDVEPGTYKLSVQNAGKKIKKNAFNKTITLKAGAIVYYKFYNVLRFLKDQASFKSIEMNEGEQLLQVLLQENSCIQTINFNPPIISNKKFHFQFQVGSSNYTSDYKNWKNRFGDPLVTHFNPFTIGGEFSVRLGANNHYLGFELFSNQLPSIAVTPNIPNSEERLIRINQLGFLYRYLVKLDKKNRLLIAPKIGLGMLSMEERTNNSAVADNVIEANAGLSFSFGLTPEYRISKNISIIISGDYINGSLRDIKRDNINLNSFRLLFGLKYQFDN